MRLIYTFLFIIIFHFTLFPSGPKRELRGVWVATVSSIDWPSAKNYNGIKQQNEFVDLLNSHQKTGINAIFVQIRTAADALYAKSPEPWSTFLSGLQGQPPSPYYDPLAFMIEESHARGIEFHAWLNLNRASISTNSLLDANHLVRKHPEWIIKYHGQFILNFGLPEVRLYLVNLVKNLIEQYDVDGIHFDDYFYPYPMKGEEIKDREAFEKYKLPEESLVDWRRRNTNNLIKDISEVIKSTKPKVKFGISPFGIWRHQSESVLDGSPTRRGLQSYDDLFADTEKWIKDGLVDYLAPQLYWETSHKVAAFEPLAKWWSAHNYGRPIYIGHAVYHLNDAWSPSELSKQLKVARSLPNVQGSIYFSSNLITRNVKGWRDTLRQNQYSSVALIPAMLWKDSIAPTPPHQVSLLKKGDDWLLAWKPGEPSEDQDPPAYYVVYRIKKGEVDPLENAENIIFKGKMNQLILDNNWIRSGYGFAVTALDRLHNESLPGTIQWLIPTKKNNMNQRLHLTIKEITEETIDTKTIHFWHPIHNTISYISGQFFTLIPEIDGQKIRRSYSLSSSPKTDTSPAITVKRIEGGLVSNYLCDHIKVGDSLEVIEPMGNFLIEPQADSTKTYVFVAAGSGITPLFSMIKTVLHSEPKSHIYLIYGSRNEQQIIFKKALESLESQHSSRFKMIHVISQPSHTWPGFKGRINQASMVFYLKQEFGIDIPKAFYYLCGPAGMMSEVEKSLAMFDVPENHILKELFLSTASEETAKAEEDGSLKSQEVTLIFEGKTHTVTVLPSETILEAALEADIDIPYSCQAGMCTACMGLCTSGQVIMDEEDGLTDNEIKKGYILTCVAHPMSEGVVINLD